MIISKNPGLKFEIEKYINMRDFVTISLQNKEKNNVVTAAYIGLVEGIIEANVDKSFFTILGMYKIKSKTSYLFLDIYNYINKNAKFQNYIISYFNLWHKCENDEFTYDKYNKMDLCNNLNNLTELLHEERKRALESDDYEKIEIYNIFLECFSCMFLDA